MTRVHLPIAFAIALLAGGSLAVQAWAAPLEFQRGGRFGGRGTPQGQPPAQPPAQGQPQGQPGEPGDGSGEVGAPPVASGPADRQTPLRPGRGLRSWRPFQERRGFVQEPAFARGYADGFGKGMDDGRDRDRYDPVGSGDYRRADQGYSRQYGPRDAYQTNYRAGFRQGYEEGYRDGARGGRRRRDE